MYGKFLRILFLQAHRETEAHFTAAGMPSQRNQSDSFRFKRAAFYQSLKSKVGLAAAKASSGGITDQPQCRGLWHSNSPSARSLSREKKKTRWTFTTTIQATCTVHSALTKAHDWMLSLPLALSSAQRATRSAPSTESQQARANGAVRGDPQLPTGPGWQPEPGLRPQHQP
jgi:hypothetical protein